MDNKEELLNKIIEIEWEMFESVPNEGGKAACQQDPKTFRIMRHSQGMSWSEDTLASYLNDLQESDSYGGNLITEKYARMMQSTVPEQYERIKHLIPELSPEAIELVDKITEISLEWEEALSNKYPNIVQRGRPIRSSEDSPFATSVETYLRGELATYSQKTLSLYYEQVSRQKAENINGPEITLENMIKQYGFKSLEEANEKLNKQS